jgi:hypothetical protein
MTALDSWALVGMLCRHGSCRGVEPRRASIGLLWRFSERANGHFLTFGSARVLSPLKSAKDSSHATKAKAACELAGDSQKWHPLRSLTDNTLYGLSLDLIYQGVCLRL